MTTPVNRPLPPPWDVFVPLVRKLLAWGVLFAVLYLLRSFFLLIFLTFVFAYIQSHVADRLAKRIPNRSLRVVLVSTVLLGILVSIGAYLVPTVRQQAAVFASGYQNHVKAMDQAIIRLSESYPIIDEIAPIIKESKENQDHFSLKSSPTSILLQQIAGFGQEGDGEVNIRDTLRTFAETGEKIFAMGSAFLLSLLFSFLIVLDLPRLSASVRGLRDTSLRLMYEEVASDVYEFGNVLGRALEAQLFIAILNTVLTAIGIQIIGLGEHTAFLSMIVFLCSFVPVAGVFISSIPICLLALQESGVHMMVLAIALIILIHMVETYVLNPRIYGHHLHLNPVIVLSILTIGGKLFSIWGLLLGVPICTYLFGHAIRRGSKAATTITPSQ